MMKQLFFLVPAFAVVSGTPVNLTMDSFGRWRMPISARLVAWGNEVNSSVFVGIHGLYDFFFEPNQGNNSVPVDIADSLIIENNRNERTVIPTGNFSISDVPDLGFWNPMGASVRDAFGSSFRQLVPRFIVTPIGEGESGLLVLNPTTPEQYAYEGRWFCVNSCNDHFPEIEASVVVGNRTASSPAVFALLSDNYETVIPRDAFANILGYLEQAGVDVVHSTEIGQRDGVTTVRLVTTGLFMRLYATGMSALELAQILPPVYFEMFSGTERFRITLFPEDYIEVMRNGLVVTVATYTDEGLYTIGTNMLRRLGLQIDTENHRIGFAEPVDAV